MHFLVPWYRILQSRPQSGITSKIYLEWSPKFYWVRGNYGWIEGKLCSHPYPTVENKCRGYCLPNKVTNRNVIFSTFPIPQLCHFKTRCVICLGVHNTREYAKMLHKLPSCKLRWATLTNYQEYPEALKFKGNRGINQTRSKPQTQGKSNTDSRKEFPELHRRVKHVTQNAKWHGGI